MFYDKLEKANYFLENIIETSDKPTDSRLIMHLLDSPIQDGGQWDMFVNLLMKYIVGPTGSGKTTLVRLLLRFHVPNSGSIFLDGTEISKINLKDLRSSISLVTQTITLFPMDWIFSRKRNCR